MSRAVLLWSLLAAASLPFAATTSASVAITDGSAGPLALASSPDRLGFDRAPLGAGWPDDTTWGDWYSVHDGFGRTAVVDEGAGRLLRLSTRTPERPTETFSSLLHSTRAFRDVDFTVRLRTARQLRAAPNPWEVAWVLWRYTDNAHFYSFIVKPDGWELAKEDAAYPGKQRFLAYSYARSFPTGRTYVIRIRHVRDDVTVWVDGQPIVAFTDRERPYRSGSIALYAEDSVALYEPVVLRRVFSSRGG
jgi:3-keto-disaccharide hydrolase